MRLAGFSFSLVLALWVGRATFLESGELSLVWPASGIGVVWLASGNRSTWPVDLTAMAAVTGLAVAATGGTFAESLLAGILAVLQPLVYLMVMRRLAPGLWGSGGARAFARVGDVGPFLLACAAASTVSSLVRWTGLGLIAPGEPIELVVVWIRNFAWMVAIASVALQLAPALRHSGSPRNLMHRLRMALLGTTDSRGLEAGVITLATAVLYLAVFARSSEIPSTFLLMLTTVWASVRLTPAAAGLQALFSGTAAVLFTLDDRGAFVSVSDPRSSAMLAQLFLIVLSITATTLSLSIAERVEATLRATASEQAEAERAAVLGAVLQSMQEGVEVVQADGRVLVRNPAGRRLLGQSESEAPRTLGTADVKVSGLDAPHTTLFSADGTRVPYERIPCARALEGEEVIAEDYSIQSLGVGGRRIIEMTASPIPVVSADQPRRAVVTYRDVTSDRQDRDNLAAFAGVVAHDLSNPLGAVSGWADILADAIAEGPLDPDQGRELVARIQAGTARMLVLIDDLLAYTVARNRPLDVQDLDLSGLFQQTAQMPRQAGERPIIDIQPRMEVRADPALVRQVADNLISNAVKYVAPGVRPRIEITARTRGAMLEISVSDNGIGVPADHQDRIFDNFHRVHPAGYPGTGIGLAICRRVVERHGGRIAAEDGPRGSGTTFVFTLPR